VLLFAGVAIHHVEARELTLDDRVRARRAIEEVYWKHRIWPADNPQPKPPLGAVLSDPVLRARVIDDLKKSNALSTWWHRPITQAALQAELDRMAAHTQNARILNEIYDALGRDPDLVAETVARPILADRLIRSWYAVDDRFHDALRAHVRAVRDSCADWQCLEAHASRSARTRWIHDLGDTRNALHSDAVVLGDAAWTEHRARLSRLFGSDPDRLPVGRWGPVEETGDSLSVTMIVSSEAHELTTATVVWPKAPFVSWWGAEAPRFGTSVPSATDGYHLSVPATGNSCSADTWTPLFRDVPDPRERHTAVWTGSEMLVWGGDDPAYQRTGGRYDPSTDSWSSIAVDDNVPAARYKHTAIWTGTEMIVWGGYGPGAGNTGGRYNPTTNSWTPTSTAGNAPAGRTEHTAVWTGSEMIVWGGNTTGTLSVNTGARYNPSTDSWAATSTGVNVATGRAQHTAVWTGSEMIVWGGTTTFATGGRYNPSTDSWAAMSSTNGPGNREFDTALWTGTEMIIWGGQGDGTFWVNTGARYNPVTNTWTKTSTGANVPVAREWHSAVWTGTEMIVWGGTGGGVHNTGGRYNPVTDTWVPTSLGANVPVGRYWHTAIWDGSEMIVWGGALSSGVANSGGRYSPSTDSWVPTDAGASMPVARYAHAAVFTGSEMIIWGGIASEMDTATGARYSPSTDSWTPVSMQGGVPSARRNFSAVWTGRDVVVWGGSGPFLLNTGGRYDPSLDAWTATSVTGACPAPRELHSATWTGSEMIVWGGSGGDPLDTGARYDPESDTWASMSPAGAAAASRYAHSVVWTGQQMIVWGGWDGSSDVSSGGRYDPQTDGWTPVAQTGAPDGRELHTAVWTGNEMIVWGGLGSAVFRTGSRYDPAGDAWHATTTTGAPTARYLHSATWSGAEMIVWGGIDGVGNDTNAGARYNPATDAWVATSIGRSVPSARDWHSAVWTGNEVIIWAGRQFGEVNTGARYCACPNPLLPPPGALVGLTLAKAPFNLTRLSWPPVAGALRYDMVQGNLNLLRSSHGNFSTASVTCVSDDNASTTASEDSVPMPGQASWYLVRAEGCGGTGTFQDNGLAGGNPRDDGIAGASNACP
jgi:N-acetylneuraminic acid mutarotase